jgi:hypothetical protein
MNKLPTLEELNADPAEAYKVGQLNWLLNQPPPANWVSLHPIIKVKNELNAMVPMPYLSIDKVEFMMTRIFGKWYVEVISVQALFNSIVTTVRVHYWNAFESVPEWRHTDGIGAMGVQTDQGAKASDLSSIKLAAVQMAGPASESYAIKDACEKLGKIFGRDLSRKNTINYEPFEPPQQPQVQQPTPQQQLHQVAQPWGVTGGITVPQYPPVTGMDYNNTPPSSPSIIL